MMNKTRIFVLFLVLKSVCAFAGSHAQDTVDRRLYDYAKNTPEEITQDIDKLVDYLKQPAAGQKDVVKTFSYWIMQNISYDIYAFLTTTPNTEGITATLRDKKGVCQDYSELFKAMCDRAGVKCYIITGYAKAFDYKPGTRFAKANHAWNMVWLDGAYFLMDLTWSSGYVQFVDDRLQFFLRTDISQFFTDPAEFVQKHLPSDPKWQLLNHPVSMDAFLRYDGMSKIQFDSSRYFNYADSISKFDRLGKEEQELKAADDAYNFYPVLSDYAYHYYNLAVTYSNKATDFYNAAVASYNKAVANNQTPSATGDYNPNTVADAIDYYNKAISFLSKIRTYSDNNINAGSLLENCTAAVNVSKELLKTLKP